MVQVFLLAMVIIGFSLAARGAQAATYYVSPSGSDSNNGSRSAPFQTIQQAANIVNPGDTVIVENGVYSDTSGTAYGGGWSLTLSLWRSGTASNPITFISQNKWGAILDGLGSTQMGVAFFGVSCVSFKNFTIRNYTNSGIIGGKPTASYTCTISGNNIHNNAGTGIIFDANPSAPSSYITINSNMIHDNGTASAINKTHGIYLTTDNHVTVMNNVFYNNVGGWDIQLYDHDPGYSEDSIIIVGNTFASTGSPYSGGQIINYYQHQATNLIIEDNIFYHPAGGHAINDNNGCGYTLANNLTTASVMSTQRCTGTNNILNTNPLFVSAGSNDYHLISSRSPAYQAGLWWSGRTHDADGNHLRNHPNIGAYKYVAPFSMAGVSKAANTGTYSATASKTKKVMKHKKLVKRARMTFIYGTVTAVEATANTLTVKTRKSEVSLYVAAKVWMRKGGKKINLADVKTGDRVHVGYTTANGKKVAEHVYVYAAKKAKKAKSVIQSLFRRWQQRGRRRG